MKVQEIKDHYVARTYLGSFQNSSDKLYACKKDTYKFFVKAIVLSEQPRLAEFG